MEKSGITFIHISDVNLGFVPEADLKLGTDRFNEIKETFANTIKYAKEHKADFVFISGDLFNSIPDIGMLEELDRTCSILEDTCVVYCSGDQDYMGHDLPIWDYDFKSNIYVIGRSRLPENQNKESRFYAKRSENASYMLDCLRFLNMGIDVYGVSYFDKKNSISSLEGVIPADSNRINILLAHGGEGKYLPIDFSELKNSGFDYVALGHKHKYTQISDNICYAGSLEPLADNEQGRHGFIFGSLTKDSFSKQFIPFSKREYKTFDYPVNNYTKDADIASDIEHLIGIEGKQHIYTINIVRLDDCEKNFELYGIADKYNILAINGLSFERTDYDCYIKTNRNNSFARLLDEMYAESPVKRDGAKLAVDTVIDISGINKRKGNKMSSRVFDDACKQAVGIFSARLEAAKKSEEICDFEQAKEKLSVSPDVLDKLNDTWAKERKAELEYRTFKKYYEEFPRKRQRERTRMILRVLLIPIIVFGVFLIITFPQGLIKASLENNSDKYAISMLIVAFSIILGVYLIYLLSKRIVKTDSLIDIEKKNDEKTVLGMLEERRDKVDLLRDKRHELQLLESNRKGLLEEVSEKERKTEKIYYEMKVLSEAIDILMKY